jgi:hypothetical protein
MRASHRAGIVNVPPRPSPPRATRGQIRQRIFAVSSPKSRLRRNRATFGTVSSTKNTPKTDENAIKTDAFPPH